jgi:hypothetical protein
MLLSAGLAVLVAAAAHHWQQSTNLAAVERAVRDAEQPVPRAPTKRDHGVETRARWIERELHLPWPALFHALETTRTSAIRINAIEAVASSGEVSLQGQARRLTDVIELAERLADRSLHDVVIRSHQPLAEASDRPLGFQLGARWTTGGMRSHDATVTERSK